MYVADNISYQIRNEKIIKLTDQKLADELETGNTATALINRVRDGIAGSCGENYFLAGREIASVVDFQ